MIQSGSYWEPLSDMLEEGDGSGESIDKGVRNSLM